MAIGISEDHRQLQAAVRGRLEREVPPEVVRDGFGEHGRAPVRHGRAEWWDGLAGQGLLGLHLPGEFGGGGGDLLDLAVVLEETGRAVLPGAYLPTVLASTVLAAAGGAEAKRRLAALAEGSCTGALALEPGGLRAEPVTGGWRLSGDAGPVLGGDQADLLLLAAALEGGESAWFAVEAAEPAVRPLPALDLTRGVASVEADGLRVGEEQRLAVDAEQVAALASVVLAAEACGIAGWALDTAAGHARVREQFGRPIGKFQAVKHLCAWMLVRAEAARAATWQAAREPEPLAAAIAAALALEAAFENAKDCIQVLGGIGFTWEHPAHLRLRRALAVRQFLGIGAALNGRVARIAGERGLHRPALELPPEAEEFRTAPRAAAAAVQGLAPAEQRRRLAPGGWTAPHLPPPYGLGADALRQLVVEQELRAAGVVLPDLTIGTWVIPSIVAHGTPEQRERFVMPTLKGELTWCQLFSEPEAGSDLASLRTRAVRLPDGCWQVDGQKVWTSSARTADFGILLARTSPDRPKHQGLTYFLVDMRTTPGIDIRPLRELTGDAVFNEVFLDGVVLPADAVVGEVDGGWRVARHTLGHERVHMADSSPTADAVRRLLTLPGADSERSTRLGRLVAVEHALACIDLRTALSSLDGLDPGPGASVRKLLSAPHAQNVAELALELCGPAGAVAEGVGGQAARAFLMARCLTIAGGTTQVQLNVVAERILGLPRD
ncbi:MULTISPECIES: acyl-CoA dehydrogenase [Streptacidiphilus]|uniref:Acyl-CoA dehydrogenase family protein n=1 Tax=Streptacidiphilus cavernicola TaxID=3342716 RepID=A0ABV6UFK2_9ACTN|nr:acyl-CoA dehydrogenase [Streptacidiphilus jeojiense]